MRQNPQIVRSADAWSLLLRRDVVVLLACLRRPRHIERRSIGIAAVSDVTRRLALTVLPREEAVRRFSWFLLIIRDAVIRRVVVVIHIRVIDRGSVVLHHGPQCRRAAAHGRVLARLHLREDSAEPRAEARDPLVRVFERQFLPRVVVGLDRLQVDQILLAAGASHRPEMLLAEHSSLVVAFLSAPEQLKYLLDLLRKLGEALVHFVLGRELAEQLLDHLADPVQDGILQVDQIGLVRLRW